jgi:predicted PolB exonuclease-like 3'-5' exonuclease
VLHKNIFVFDIETVPDTEAVYNLTGFESDNTEELKKKLEEYHIEVTNNPFLRQPFHKVVAISFLEATIEQNVDRTEKYILTDLRSGGTEGSTEEEIIKGLFNHLVKKAPRFVSYNGRTFDLPVLKYRAMKYGISVPWLYKSGDKWNNYSQRYSLDWHCDLLEAFSDFGASARCKMNEICSIMGIPGKIGVDGSQVSELYDNGKIKKIRDYCETDVINTYLLYLNYQYHTGSLNKDNFFNACVDLKNYLEDADKEHFFEFLTEWKKFDSRNLF